MLGSSPPGVLGPPGQGWESSGWETFGDEPVSGSPTMLLKLWHVKVAHPVFTAPPTHRDGGTRSPGCRLTQPGHATGEGPLGAGSDGQAACVSSRRPPAARGVSTPPGGPGSQSSCTARSERLNQLGPDPWVKGVGRRLMAGAGLVFVTWSRQLSKEGGRWGQLWPARF